MHPVVDIPRNVGINSMSEDKGVSVEGVHKEVVLYQGLSKRTSIQVNRGMSGNLCAFGIAFHHRNLFFIG